jgi:arsenate reductase
VQTNPLPECCGMKTRVLFICSKNSARSQMAEGFLRSLYGGMYDAFSAGTDPDRLHPMAVRVMQEAGVDISRQRAKHLHEFLDHQFDIVVTICDDSRGACPVFPGAKHTIHHPFEDPAVMGGAQEVRLRNFRRVRDEIRSWIIEQFGSGDSDPHHRIQGRLQSDSQQPHSSPHGSI